MEIPKTAVPDFLLDGMRILEAKACFLSMASEAMSMLSEADFNALCNRHAWEGLGWYTTEIADMLHRLNNPDDDD